MRDFPLTRERGRVASQTKKKQTKWQTKKKQQNCKQKTNFLSTSAVRALGRWGIFRLVALALRVSRSSHQYYYNYTGFTLTQKHTSPHTITTIKNWETSSKTHQYKQNSISLSRRDCSPLFHHTHSQTQTNKKFISFSSSFSFTKEENKTKRLSTTKWTTLLLKKQTNK